jgi:PAS domain S-box-containing protein
MEIRSRLIESNSKLKLASEIANLGYWTNDLVNAKLHWSEEIYKIFELNPKTFDLNINAVKAMFHPEDQINFDPNVYGKFEDSTIKESEHRIITGTGKLKWILERQYLIKDKNNNPIKLEGIALDITKRKLHEQEISESNERLKTLAKATIEAIIDWDIVNDTVMWGEGFHTMFGYDLNVYNNTLWSSNTHPEDREKVLDDLHKILGDPTKLHFNAEFRFLKANGEVAYVQHKGIFVRDVNGRATRALAAMIDLTEVLSRIHRIEQQNKALEYISYTQSHVVRAPLANLLGLVVILKDNNEQGNDNNETIEHIKNSAEKLDEIIKDIVNKSSGVHKEN